MGTEQALKNGISAYHYNILKLLKEWQPVVFNTKEDAIAWRNVSTGEEVDTEMLDWVGDIEVGEPLPRVPWANIDVLEKCLSGCEQDNLRRKSRDLFEYVSLLEARHEEIYPSSVKAEVDTASSNQDRTISLIDYVIECLANYREKHQDLIRLDDIEECLPSMIQTIISQYRYAYAKQVGDDVDIVNHQYGIDRQYLDEIDGVMESQSLDHLNSSQLEVAREWLIDCFSTQEEEIREASSAVIEAEVIRLCGSLDALDYGDDSEEPLISDIRAILHNQS